MLLLLPLLSQSPGPRHVALLYTCVTLMPALLLDAASLLQSNAAGSAEVGLRAHHRRTGTGSSTGGGSSSFWLTESEPEYRADDEEPVPILKVGAHGHGGGRGHHHRGRTSHRSQHHRAGQKEASQHHHRPQEHVPSYRDTVDQQQRPNTQTFRFDEPSPFSNPDINRQQKHERRRNKEERYIDDGEDDEEVEEVGEYQQPGFPVNPRPHQRKHTYSAGTGNDYQNDESLVEESVEDEEYYEDEDEDEDDDDEDFVDDDTPPQDSRLHGRLTPCPGCQRITDQEVVVGESGAPRPTGRRYSDAEMKNMLIERIKQQILAKLRLPAAPNATRRHTRLPEPLARADPMLGDQAPSRAGEVFDDPDDFYGKTTQVVTFATQIRNCPHDRSIACFHFDLTGKVDASDVKTAELWVYKQPDSADPRPQTLVFSKIAGQHHNISKVGKEIGHKVVSVHQGWIPFDIKRQASRWLSNPDRNLGMAIHCKTCRDVRDLPVATSGDHMPFVIIHTSLNHQVYRRSTNDCGAHSGNECCRERFYVNFASIDWDWITWPPGYYANYCKGTCHGESPISPKYQHSNLMQQVAIVERNEELSPCCAPRKMTPLSLLYIMDGDYIRKHLPNMAVESCSCT